MNFCAKKPKENGRDRLIASALKLFSEKSFHGVSVREICDAAHANPSLISFHFGGKDSLLETIFQEQLATSKFKDMEKILSVPQSVIDMKVKLEIFLESYVDFYLENREVVTLYFDELERGHDLARNILPLTYGKVWDRLVAFIGEAQEKQLVDDSLDVQILSYQIMSPFLILIRNRLTSFRRADKNLDDSGFKKRLIHQVVYSIK